MNKQFIIKILLLLAIIGGQYVYGMQDGDGIIHNSTPIFSVDFKNGHFEALVNNHYEFDEQGKLIASKNHVSNKKNLTHIFAQLSQKEEFQKHAAFVENTLRDVNTANYLVIATIKKNSDLQALSSFSPQFSIYSWLLQEENATHFAKHVAHMENLYGDSGDSFISYAFTVSAKECDRMPLWKKMSYFGGLAGLIALVVYFCKK